jgi:hypothetical protein
MPPQDVDIGSIDHGIMRKARELTAEYPKNLVRIVEIRETHVFRFTHGRTRVATWLDRETGVVWVCAADERDDDTYDHFVDLYNAGELLPDERDSIREETEAAARFLRSLTSRLPIALDEAIANPNVERRVELEGGSLVRIIVIPGDLQEVWIAMPTLNAAAGLTPRMRGMVIAVADTHLSDALWEQRYQWPAGRLDDHEIAHLAVREAG